MFVINVEIRNKGMANFNKINELKNKLQLIKGPEQENILNNTNKLIICLIIFKCIVKINLYSNF